jgi:hypothetical protein
MPIFLLSSLKVAVGWGTPSDYRLKFCVSDFIPKDTKKNPPNLSGDFHLMVLVVAGAKLVLRNAF